MIEDREVVPPCKILFRNGQPCEELVTERTRFDERFARISIPPRQKAVSYAPRVPGRPKVAKVKKPAGRPGRAPGSTAWNRMDDVTVERILELQDQGMIAEEIGKQLGCTKDTVYARLRVSRRNSLAAAQEDITRRTCACGRKKWASHDVCTYCRTGRKLP